MACSDHRRCFRGLTNINGVRDGCLTHWKDIEADLYTNQSIQHFLHLGFECFAIAAVRSVFTGLEV